MKAKKVTDKLEDKCMENKKDDTKKYKASDVNKKAKKSMPKNKEKKKKTKAGKIIKILIIVLLLAIIIGSGIVVGVFYGMFGDQLTISKEEFVIPYENSTVYDKDGNLIATLSGDSKRKCISLSEMGQYLPKAYVAIEDERFYEHQGVDIKRTAAATITYVTHAGKSSFGGSSITQQLVKNITNEKEDSNLAGVVRKVKEMSKAMQVEQYLSKDQILELYLNLIFIGGNDINGVELGAIYYFNKKPAELTIAQCAFMAGINHSPNAYNPFKEEDEAKKAKKQENIKKRTKTVLGKMLELGNINQEEYETAKAEVEAGLPFSNGDTSPTVQVSYTVEAALNQILEQLMEEKNMSRSYAETYLYSSGLKIYTTQDTAIQATVEEVIKQDKYCTVGKSKKKDGTTLQQNSIPTVVVMDHTNGNVVAASTAVGEKGARETSTKLGYFNIPAKLRKSTGSSMKPISVIAPGLESGAITGATVYNDTQTTFKEGNYKPKNYYIGFKGLMNLRTAIEISANVPHVKALADIGLETSKAFCESVGLPKFEREGLSLALGGLEDGATVTEMTGAYAAIANNGTYIEPTFYKYVTDKEDNVVVEPKQTVNRVLSDQNAYITKNILTQPVVGPAGTAKYCAIKGMDVAAKTGTTNGDYDRWLAGFTPYYTAICWYGYESNAEVVYSSGNPAGKIWAEVMKKIHEGLEGSRFTRPEGIKEVAICKATGLRATEKCKEVYTELFTESTIPEECDNNAAIRICTETNLLATETCPFAEERYINTVPPKERGTTKWSPAGASSEEVPTEYCPHDGTVTEEPQVPTPEQPVNNTPPETPNEGNNNSNNNNTSNNSGGSTNPPKNEITDPTPPTKPEDPSNSIENTTNTTTPSDGTTANKV